MTEDERTLYAFGPYVARHLDPARDLEALQRLCLECRDYYLLSGGKEPGPSAARDIFSAGPPGRALKDRMVLGLFDGPHLAGVYEGFKDYPEPGTWWLGLVVLEPSRRGQGIGSQVYRAFEAWAATQGVRTVGLGVIELNAGAHRFWRRMGFEAVRLIPGQPLGDTVTTVTHYRRDVAPGSPAPGAESRP